MRHLFYAGSSVLVADITCKAVLRYARALAEAKASDIAMIPVITDGGSQGIAHILIGPSSQLLSTHVPDSVDEPVDMDVIEDLERKTRELFPATPSWPSEMTDIPAIVFDSELDI